MLSDYRSYLRPGARFTILVGHDPGNIFNTSVVFRLLMFGLVPTWVTAVGELQTQQTTAHQHGRALIEYLRTMFFVNLEGDPSSDRAIVFCDPHGKGESQTDYQTVYGAFQKEGLDVFNPAGSKPTIKRKPRIEMLNRLFCSAKDVVQLVVGQTELGTPMAPAFVEALETLKKRPGEDDPEGSSPQGRERQDARAGDYRLRAVAVRQEHLSAMTFKRARAAAGMR